MKPKESRINVVKASEEEVIIEIPPRGLGMDSLFLGMWLTGWSAGLIFAVSEFIRHLQPLLLIWIVGGLFAEVMALYLFCWPIFGREFIGVGKNAVVQVKRIFGFTSKKAFDVGKVEKVTIVRGTATFRGAHQLALRYDGKLVELAQFADDDERKWLLEEIGRMLSGDFSVPVEHQPFPRGSFGSLL